MAQTKQSASPSGAQFAFYYCLSLVALVLLATSVGSIAFQIINKFIVDVVSEYSTGFNSQALKFAISAIIISAPLYYFTTSRINKALFEGRLPNDSGIRRWLSYFILFVSSVVTLGYLIGVLFSFLDGEITLKFILKALTSVIISDTVFGYYFYDIKRKMVKGAKDKIIKLFFWGSLVMVIAALVSAFLIGDSPKETRLKKLDRDLISKLSNIDNAINIYYSEFDKLPLDKDDLLENSVIASDVGNRYGTGEYEYEKTDEKKFKLCAEFNLAGDPVNNMYNYVPEGWDYEAGYHCFERRITDAGKNMIRVPESVPVKEKAVIQ